MAKVYGTNWEAVTRYLDEYADLEAVPVDPTSETCYTRRSEGLRCENYDASVASVRAWLKHFARECSAFDPN